MLNGGYILLDLTKYDLNLDSDDFDYDDTSTYDDYEISKETYDEIIKKCEYVNRTGKPIVVSSTNLYDAVTNRCNILQSAYNSGTIQFAYFDSADGKIRFLIITEIGTKYYAYTSDDNIL